MVVVEDLVLFDFEIIGLGIYKNIIKIVVLRIYFFNVNMWKVNKI